MVTFRPIDLETDREFILEVRVQTLFQDETPWARSPGLPSYRHWYLSSRHPDQFFKLLARSLRDPRTIADVVEVEGTAAGFVWATFVDVPESDFTYLELRAMGLRPEFQRPPVLPELPEAAPEAPVRFRQKALKTLGRNAVEM